MERAVSQLIGEIRRFPEGKVPDNWISCDGSVLPIAEHQPLFSLLGWRFGGDGWTTFRLPAIHAHAGALAYAIALNGTELEGQTLRAKFDERVQRNPDQG